jgi:DNA-binding transcriptional regulator PaaX
MVDPVTVAAVASVGSGVMGFKGAKSAAKADKAVTEYENQVRENEAVLLRREKADQEKNLRQQSDRLVGQQRAATAASGIQMSGSPLQALADSYFKTEQDALRIQYAGDIEETKKEADIALNTAESNARQTAFKVQGYQSLLQGASQGATLLG